MNPELNGWESTATGWTREYNGLQLAIQDTGEPESWLVTVAAIGAEEADAETLVTGAAGVAAEEAMRLADGQHA